MIIGYLFWGILTILCSISLGTRKEEDDFKQTTNGTGEFCLRWLFWLLGGEQCSAAQCTNDTSWREIRSV